MFFLSLIDLLSNWHIEREERLVYCLPFIHCELCHECFEEQLLLVNPSVSDSNYNFGVTGLRHVGYRLRMIVEFERGLVVLVRSSEIRIIPSM